jgi:hypothetical protein
MEEQPNNDFIIALDRWNGWKLNLQDANFLFFTIKDKFNGVDTYYDRDSNPKAINPEVWTHVVVTYADSLMNFYVNGELVKAWTNCPGSPVAVDNINLSIGSDLPTSVYTTIDGDQYFVNWGGFWKGDIDDIRFYNIAITASQVQSIYTFEKDHVVVE